MSLIGRRHPLSERPGSSGAAEAQGLLRRRMREGVLRKTIMPQADARSALCALESMMIAAAVISADVDPPGPPWVSR
jgi:hypothetical protein